MRIVLDHTSSTPLYRQIKDEIRAKILSGELKPGDPLPPIRQLAADLLTSVITTKRAYQELESEGLIVTRSGRGTFVRNLEGSVEELRLKDIEEQLRKVVRNAIRLGIRAETLPTLLEKIIEMEGLKDE